jgi:hypothetical protein
MEAAFLAKALKKAMPDWGNYLERGKAQCHTADDLLCRRSFSMAFSRIARPSVITVQADSGG